MRKMLTRFFVFMVIFSVFPAAGYCKTGYVSDSLLLTFRQGPGNSYPVLKTLKSNTPVNVIEEKDGYYKVELTSKEMGWVDKKFITFELPSFYIAKDLEAKNKVLESRIESLESSNTELADRLSSVKDEYTQTINELNAALEELKAQNTQLLESSEIHRKKYDTLVDQSKDILRIIQENKDYQKENQILAKDLEILQNKNKSSFRSGMIKWFVAGVVVLLAGWILGSGVSSKRHGSGSLLY